jgi:hypothetical protein
MRVLWETFNSEFTSNLPCGNGLKIDCKFLYKCGLAHVASDIGPYNATGTSKPAWKALENFDFLGLVVLLLVILEAYNAPSQTDRDEVRKIYTRGVYQEAPAFQRSRLSLPQERL